MKQLGLQIAGSFLNADAGFDTKVARKICHYYKFIPNIMENQRALKKPKLWT